MMRTLTLLLLGVLATVASAQTPRTFLIRSASIIDAWTRKMITHVILEREPAANISFDAEFIKMRTSALLNGEDRGKRVATEKKEPTTTQLLEIIRTQTEIAKLGLDLSGVMELVAQEARAVTRAAGAVVELAGKQSIRNRQTHSRRA